MNDKYKACVLSHISIATDILASKFLVVMEIMVNQCWRPFYWTPCIGTFFQTWCTSNSTPI